MDWYYAQDEQQLGPVSEAEFDALVEQGAVTLTTLVWHDGMTDWQPFGEVARRPSDSAPPSMGAPAMGSRACAECGRTFQTDDMIRYGDAYVCATCKPIFFQRVREGVPLDADFEYGGFWIRFGAKIIDGIIMGAVQLPVMFIFGLALSPTDAPSAGPLLMMMLVNYGLPIVYTVFFLGRFGATPGKMALGLKVVRPTGESISYLRAFGRYLAEILSALIFLIGYIMAAFDEEKRSLHDRICDTRVIRTR